MLDPDTLARWKALADAATPGLWEVEHCGEDNEPFVFYPKGGDSSLLNEADAAFIAAAREAVPKLVREVERLQAVCETWQREWTERSNAYETTFAELQAENRRLRNGLLEGTLGHIVTARDKLREATIAELRRKLDRYGDHVTPCTLSDAYCTCGWANIEHDLDATPAGEGAMAEQLTAEELALLKSYGCEYPWRPQDMLRLIWLLERANAERQGLACRVAQLAARNP